MLAEPSWYPNKGLVKAYAVGTVNETLTESDAVMYASSTVTADVFRCRKY